ncbi:hypothetical protein K470DRAFT_288075 [Piedraia hortae CBS 480.64]|uniref:Uncharacterized protein n=1 Tax=Piedraia hortae CBS 480.64 TaxID=1314780 RepID=A0A6A7BVV8_9PEZI|nr:hypothetical protein K470DRAFT_288075 [Piedraia hortae CBS 480.64]
MSEPPAVFENPPSPSNSRRGRKLFSTVGHARQQIMGLGVEYELAENNGQGDVNPFVLGIGEDHEDQPGLTAYLGPGLSSSLAEIGPEPTPMRRRLVRTHSDGSDPFKDPAVRSTAAAPSSSQKRFSHMTQVDSEADWEDIPMSQPNLLSAYRSSSGSSALNVAMSGQHYCRPFLPHSSRLRRSSSEPSTLSRPRAFTLPKREEPSHPAARAQEPQSSSNSSGGFSDISDVMPTTGPLSANNILSMVGRRAQESPRLLENPRPAPAPPHTPVGNKHRGHTPWPSPIYYESPSRPAAATGPPTPRRLLRLGALRPSTLFRHPTADDDFEEIELGPIHPQIQGALSDRQMADREPNWRLAPPLSCAGHISPYVMDAGRVLVPPAWASHGSIKQEQRKISLIFQALSVLFPPLAILYGLGKLDVLARKLSKGRVQALDPESKRDALYVLAPLSMLAYVIIGLTIGLIVHFNKQR